MAVRSTNTFTEMLQKLLRDIADMKIEPDADLPWLVNLETLVLQKLREPINNMQQQGSTQVGPPQMPGGMPGMQGPPPGMQGPPPGMMQGPPPVPGVMQGRPMPNPDELRRVIRLGATI